MSNAIKKFVIKKATGDKSPDIKVLKNEPVMTSACGCNHNKKPKFIVNEE